MNKPFRFFVPLALILLFPAANAHGDAGQLDTSFNPGTGIGTGLVIATAVQPDGKVIIAGSFTSFNGVAQNRIARLNVNGSLDSSFAIGSGPNAQVNAVAIQPDGKIIIGGDFTGVSTITAQRIARLNPNGSVDTSFNPHPAFDVTNGADNSITDIEIQPDGKVVIGGIFRTYRTVQRNLVARLLSDGTLDTSFNPGSGPDNYVSAVAVDASGRVLIGGAFTMVAGQPRGGIARLNSNGTLDSSFAGAGANGPVSDLVVRSDGKILAGGLFGFYNSTSARDVVRINPNGSLDSTFTSALPPDAVVNSLALQPSGKIIVGGRFTTSSGPGVTAQNNLTRLNQNGSVDTSFKPGTGPNDEVYTLSLTPDDKIVIGGKFSTFNGISRKGVARLLGINPTSLRNISTRSIVQTGDRVAIAGFIITGGTKEVLLRGIGPSLTPLGVPGALQDPLIQLYNSSGALINSNNNWRDTQENAIAETTLQPSDNREAAFLITLGPGSYTVHHRGNNDTTGNGLIEVYDLTGGAVGRLANISTRAFIGAGDNVMIGGFIVGGENARVVVRAIGPSLAAAGIPGALADPRVALYDGNGSLVGFNQDWRDGQEAEIIATGLQPSNNLEAALVVTIPAGNYTSVAEGSGGTTGVGLVEVYNIQ